MSYMYIYYIVLTMHVRFIRKIVQSLRVSCAIKDSNKNEKLPVKIK